jgi:Flp pilus assembly protein TadG
MLRIFKGREGGQALVETALILPILILLLFGSIEIGRLCFVYISVNNAARTAVRVASLGASNAEITNAINDATILDDDSFIIEIDPDVEASRISGEEVSVAVSYPVQLIAPLIGIFTDNPDGIYDVDAAYTMRLE